jgi:hypothetical protein
MCVLIFINRIEQGGPLIHVIRQKVRTAMPNYESYRDVLNEHATRRNVFGSSMIIVLVALAAAVAVSVL